MRLMSGMSVCVKWVSCCMEMALAIADGQGQLDYVRTCMLGQGVRGRSKFFVSPCMSTSAR